MYEAIFYVKIPKPKNIQVVKIAPIVQRIRLASLVPKRLFRESKMDIEVPSIAILVACKNRSFF